MSEQIEERTFFCKICQKWLPLGSVHDCARVQCPRCGAVLHAKLTVEAQAKS